MSIVDKEYLANFLEFGFVLDGETYEFRNYKLVVDKVSRIFSLEINNDISRFFTMQEAWNFFLVNY